MEDNLLATGSLAHHEIYQASVLIADMVDSLLIQHPLIQTNPDWLKIASEAEELLLTLYNSIAKVHTAQRRDYYVNEDHDPRACDYCGRTYRGPAVYCSRACAEADA